MVVKMNCQKCSAPLNGEFRLYPNGDIEIWVTPCENCEEGKRQDAFAAQSEIDHFYTGAGQ